MKVEGLRLINNIGNLQSRVTKPFQKAVCKSTVIAGLSAAALSGAYLAHKSLQENEKEEQFFLGESDFHNFINENKGEKILDMKAVNFLTKT